MGLFPTMSGAFRGRSAPALRTVLFFGFRFSVSLFDSARFQISAAKLSGLPTDLEPEIAFAGRSNAGKSTTINVLTRKTRLAFASKTPGRTQLINFFELSRRTPDGRARETVGRLVDLPGYGFAKANESVRGSWSDLVGGYIAKREQLAGLVIVMDARRPFMPTDEWLIEFMRGRPEVKMLWLLNKCDQIKNMERRATLKVAEARAAAFGPQVNVQFFSGLKREGVDELARTLESWLPAPAAAATPVSTRSEGSGSTQR